MLIAQSKRKTNIVEYLLYMYQIEDIIRSFQFNLSTIDATIVQKHEQPEEVKLQINEWYAALIKKMQQNKLERSGHLPELRNTVAELQNLHDQLLTTYFDKKYIDLYDSAQPVLKELAVKTVGQGLVNEIDVAVHGVYGYLVLRLKQKNIGEETQSAITKITSFLAHLAVQYHKKEAGKLEIPTEQRN